MKELQLFATGVMTGLFFVLIVMMVFDTRPIVTIRQADKIPQVYGPAQVQLVGDSGNVCKAWDLKEGQSLEFIKDWTVTVKEKPEFKRGLK